MNVRSSRVTGVVLAGGQARRMGGIDKGLVTLAGKPMVQWVFDVLAPQVDQVIVNANRNHEVYGALASPGVHTSVVPDVRQGFLGPLSGMSSAMTAIANANAQSNSDADDSTDSEWIVTVPCDSPFLPNDLVSRLRNSSDGADIVTCHDGERLQPVFSLIRVSLLSSLDEFLDAGERKIDRWFASQRHATSDFSHTPETFININTEQEREEVESKLA